ncbi:ABC transporter substrate-binding protein [Castellaniella defragrans]|uniref:ABC transporter substrate-binding protein n=1 Tax=Castellaniella defragrans TaxID=75697 RepID=UPI002AFECC72|nr:ABC transporter substrate-binding protein [Castellaniella defragrans]
MKTSRTLLGILALASACVCAAPAQADDTLKLAVGQRGNWDTIVSQLGQDAGIFKKHGLELEILYTQGGGETLQAVISNSVDIGVAAGTIGVFSAFQKGAPIRIIGAQATGAADFWYVRADSPLHSIKDATPQTTIAYSTNGSSTNSVALGFAKTYGLKSKLVATGNPSATFTQVMTKQVDVGWSSPPFGFDALAQGKIRIVAKANDLDEIRHESIRTLIGNVNLLEHKQDQLKRFMAAYRETIDWMYASDDALKAYAAFNKTDVATARKVRDEFFPKSLIDPDKMAGLDLLNKDGIAFKTISEPLTPQQFDTLIQIPPRQ